MNWLKRRKKSLLRLKPQNNFDTGNLDIFSQFYPWESLRSFCPQN